MQSAEATPLVLRTLLPTAVFRVIRFAAILLLLQSTASLGQQVPADPKPGAPDGRVVNSKTGEPIRRANITARNTNSNGRAPGSTFTGSTDDEGKFHINSTPATYMLSAER